MAVPFISLVVVNYNGESIIKLCLDSLKSVDYPKDRYEILVVDNASTDSSISITREFLGVRVIRNKSNMGYVGVNSCLSVVKGKYIFVLNNDLKMDGKCLKKLVDVMEKDGSIGIGVPKFINFYNKNLRSGGTWVSRAFYNGHYPEKNKEGVKEVPYLGIEMVRTDLVRKFGYIYDPDYFIYAEDLDLSLRLRLMGYKTVMVPEAVIYHMHSVTTKKMGSSFTTFLMERNLLTTFFKILSFQNVLLFFPYVLGMRVVAMLRDIFSFRFSVFYSRLRAIVWIVFNLGKVMKKRKEIQKLRKVGDDFILKVFSEKYLFRKPFTV